MPWARVIWWLPALYALWVSIVRLPAASVPLFPDAVDYYLRAEQFMPEMWWSGSLREPLWPLANSAVFAVFGTSPTTLRMSSVVMFVALIVATQYLAREVVGTWAAIGVGAVLAASEWMLAMAATGLREQAAAAGAVLVGYLVVNHRPGWRWPLVIGLVVAASSMVRWDALILTLPVVAFAFWQVRLPWRKVAGVGALLAVVIVPFCVGNAIEFDDPLWHSNAHSVFFRNHEFGGQPGFPTREELAKNGFAGEPETWGGYLFELHDVEWVVEKTWEGTWNTALTNWSATVTGPNTPGPRWSLPTLSVTAAPGMAIPWLLLVVSAAGLVLLLRMPKGWPIAAMLVLALLQHAPIQHLMDPRLGVAAVPFMLIAAAVALRALWLHVLAAAGRAMAARAVPAEPS